MLLRLKQYRIERGLTQDKVAAQLGLSVGQVSKLERGDSAVSVERLVDFAELYGCDPADLIADAPLAGRIAVTGSLRANAWRETSFTAEGRAIALPAEGAYAAYARSAWRVDDRSMNLIYPPGALLIAIALEDLRRWLHDGERVIVTRRRADGLVETVAREYILRPPAPWLVARSDDPAEHQQLAIPYSLAEIARSPMACRRFSADGMEVALTHLVIASVRPEPAVG